MDFSPSASSDSSLLCMKHKLHSKLEAAVFWFTDLIIAMNLPLKWKSKMSPLWNAALFKASPKAELCVLHPSRQNVIRTLGLGAICCCIVNVISLSLAFQRSQSWMRSPWRECWRSWRQCAMRTWTLPLRQRRAWASSTMRMLYVTYADPQRARMATRWFSVTSATSVCTRWMASPLIPGSTALSTFRSLEPCTCLG